MTFTARSARRALAGRRPGRLPSLVADHRRGHLDYVGRMTPHGRSYLETKPFSAPPTPELPYCLRAFAHLVEHLELDLRAQVLDAGCGPGWLSELLARCGYSVTGVDLSPDMVEVARARIAAIPGPVGVGVAAMAELHAMPVRDLPWRSRFDAAVLFDAMHHLDDEVATLAAIRRSLVPGGRLFIHEAAWPRRGSVAEAGFLEEMRTHGTLESPFRPAYLRRVVREAGFVDVRRLAPIDRLVSLRRPVAAARHLVGRTLRPESNTVVARAPGARSSPADFRAEVTALGPPERVGAEVRAELRVTNAGRRWWPNAGVHADPVGVVRVAPYLAGPDGGRIELSRTDLVRPLAAGESERLHLTLPATALAGHRELRVDVVREGIAWLADLGSRPLVVPLEAGRGEGPR